MKKRKQNAITYYRVSTPRQGEVGLSLPAQRKAVRAFAKANDFLLCKEFTEIKSGANSNRTVLQQALKAVEETNGTLLIAKLDRLGRNEELVSHLLNVCVPFKAVDNPYADKFTTQINAAVAEREHDLNSERTKAGLQIARQNGVELGWYGRHVQSKLNRRLSLKFAQKMKPLLRTLHTNGITSIRAITEALNRLHIPTYRHNGQRWHLATVHKMLRQVKMNKRP